MRVQTSALCAVLVVILGAMPAGAQDPPAFVVTPFVAMGTDGSSPIGTSITFPIASAFSVDAEAAYRRGEGRFHAPSTSASLLWSLPSVGRFTPFAAAGGGLGKYGEPALFRLSTGADVLGTRSVLAMTTNAGFGFNTRVTERFGLRTDARWFRFAGQGRDQFRVALGVSFTVVR
jgi:hypothetical protein